MSDKINGTDVLLLVNTGTEESPSYVAVGSQRDASIDETNQEIDFSSKDAREARVAAGRYASTITLDALYVPDDEAYLALKEAQRAGEAILVRVSELAVETEEADAIITGFTRNFPDQAESTCAIALTVDGAWRAVGS
jgi:TP901-1 family phage major tail protein